MNLSFNGLDDACVALLASSPHVARLRVLRLGHNRVRDGGVRALVGPPSLRGLTELDLRGNRLSDPARWSLRSCFDSRVRF